MAKRGPKPKGIAGTNFPGPGPGRPRGGLSMPKLLVHMRAVWKGGAAARHEDPERVSLAEFMVSKPDAFLKQYREVEAEFRKDRREHERAKAEREAQSHAMAVPKESVQPEGAEVAVSDLARRLLAEWGAK